LQKFYLYPFKIASLLFLILPFIMVCTQRKEPVPIDTETTLSSEDISRIETLFNQAMENFRSERWSLAANSFDRLLSGYPVMMYTGESLVFATEADLKGGNEKRSTHRLLNYREFFLQDLSGESPESRQREGVLDAIVRRYSSAGFQAEGISLLMDLIPPEVKAKELGDKIYDAVEYLAFQLSVDDLEETISRHPLHVLTPVIRIHLAKRILMDGDKEGSLEVLSDIKTRSLRENERLAVRNLRSMVMGKKSLDGEVALLLPFTGSYAQYAQAVLKGVQLALHPSSGEPDISLGLEIFDTGGELSDLMNTIEEIVDDPDMLAIIGPLSSSLTVTASIKLRGKDLTLISPTASEKGLHELSSNIFSLNVVDQSLALRIAEFAVLDLGLKKFAAIFPMDDYGYRMVGAFIEKVEELGGRVLVAQGYPVSATTFDVELKRVKYYSPEAIFIPAHSEEIPMIAPQIPFYGMEDVQLLGTDGWNNRRAARLGGKYVEGAFFTDIFFEKSTKIGYNEFSYRYEEVYKEEASRVAGLGYDAMNLIAWGLKMGAGGRRSRSIDFSNLENFRGATAVYSMGESGYFQKEPLLLTITGGRVRAVEDVSIDKEDPEDLSPVSPLEPQDQIPE
jgi:branched-chain amino acid transport system substrate-binding protein